MTDKDLEIDEWLTKLNARDDKIWEIVNEKSNDRSFFLADKLSRKAALELRFELDELDEVDRNNPEIVHRIIVIAKLREALENIHYLQDFTLGNITDKLNGLHIAISQIKWMLILTSLVLAYIAFVK